MKSIKLTAFFLRVINKANKLQANSDHTRKRKDAQILEQTKMAIT